MISGKNEKAHAKYSASSSERWLNCPGSIALSLKAPPPRESKYAIEGTTAHLVLETLLKNPENPLTLSNQLSKQYGLGMVSHVEASIREIHKLKAKGAHLLSEFKSHLNFIEPDMGGTTDVAIVEEFGTLTIIDFKYGAGIPVEPKENTQMICYALGVAHHFDYNFEDVKMVIVQPRAPHPDGPVREWTTTIPELKEWIPRFKKAVELSKLETPPLKAGDHCKFCPASLICPEISNKAMRQAQIDFAPEVGKIKSIPVNPMLLTPQVVGSALQAFEHIEFYISEMRAYAMALLESGTEIPGYKLVEKRGTRKWIDVDAASKDARKIFKDLAFSEPELLSPAQFEKLGPKAKQFVEKFSTNVVSGVKLAPDTDYRQAVNQLELDFKPISKRTKK